MESSGVEFTERYLKNAVPLKYGIIPGKLRLCQQTSEMFRSERTDEKD